MVNAIRVDVEMSTSLTRASVTANTHALKEVALMTRALTTKATKTKAPTRSVKNKKPTDRKSVV